MHRVHILILIGVLLYRRLLAIPRKMPLAGFIDGIPAGPVFLMIVTAVQHQPIFGPDDMRVDNEHLHLEAFGHGGRVYTGPWTARGSRLLAGQNFDLRTNEEKQMKKTASRQTVLL